MAISSTVNVAKVFKTQPTTSFDQRGKGKVNADRGQQRTKKENGIEKKGGKGGKCHLPIGTRPRQLAVPIGARGTPGLVDSAGEAEGAAEVDAEGLSLAPVEMQRSRSEELTRTGGLCLASLQQQTAVWWGT